MGVGSTRKRPGNWTVSCSTFVNTGNHVSCVVIIYNYIQFTDVVNWSQVLVWAWFVIWWNSELPRVWQHILLIVNYIHWYGTHHNVICDKAQLRLVEFRPLKSASPVISHYAFPWGFPGQICGTFPPVSPVLKCKEIFICTVQKKIGYQLLRLSIYWGNNSY